MNVEIKQDSRGERGLFATKDIPKGKFICNLPIDYLKVGNKWFSSENVNNGPVNFRYGIYCDLPINKNRTIKKNLQMLINNEDNKANSVKELIGVSNPDRTEGYFIGHMINDSVSMSILDRDTYNKISEKRENVKISPVLELFGNRLGLKVTAKKRIKKGNELYFNYGEDYWKNYSNGDAYEINPVVNFLSR